MIGQLMQSPMDYNGLQNLSFFWYLDSVNTHKHIQKHYYDKDSFDCDFMLHLLQTPGGAPYFMVNVLS